MKILIECDKKYANEVASTLFSELDVQRFAINRNGFDLVVDMRDRYNGKGRKLKKNEHVEIYRGKFAIVRTDEPKFKSEKPTEKDMDPFDPPEFT